MTVLGYARVSTTAQDAALQLDALRRAGVERIYEEKVSALARERPRLAEALAALGPEDVLVVWRLDRLARSVSDLLALVEDIQARGASLRSLSESVDTGSAVGRLLLNVLGSIGQFERELLIERVRAGQEAARARGRVPGRRKTLTSEKETALRALVASGESVTAAARLLGLSRSVAYRAMLGSVPSPTRTSSP